MHDRPTNDLLKADLFAALGYGGDRSVYEDLLAREGLSNPRKSRIINASKRNRVAELLAERFVRACGRGDCLARVAGRAAGRTIVRASLPEHCDVCAGSNTRAAVTRMVEAYRKAGWSRLVVVGGTPTGREMLEELVADRLEVRLVDGLAKHTQKDAEPNLRWAQRVVLWGTTPLPHKVSNLYKGSHVITTAHRGVAELAADVEKSARMTIGTRQDAPRARSARGMAALGADEGTPTGSP
jgi:hypothetical protein